MLLKPELTRPELTRLIHALRLTGQFTEDIKMTATELEKRGSYDEATTFFKGIYAKMVIIFGTLGTVILATFMRGEIFFCPLEIGLCIIELNIFT